MLFMAFPVTGTFVAMLVALVSALTVSVSRRRRSPEQEYDRLAYKLRHPIQARMFGFWR